MWFRDLAELARQWVGQNTGPGPDPPTHAYTDLIFAFGLARLGEAKAAEAARQLLSRAEGALPADDQAHATLLAAYRYRILQALDGCPHAGPLPAELLDKIQDNQSLYIVDWLRRHSYILEPHQRIDPFRKWTRRDLGSQLTELADLTDLTDYEESYARANRLLKAIPGDLWRQLAELTDLTDLTDRKEIAVRVHRLLTAIPLVAETAKTRAKVLRAGLNAAPRVGAEFGREMLELTLPAYDALPQPENNITALEEQAKLLERALFVAGHFDRVEHIHPLVARFQRLLQTQRGTPAVQALDTLARECFRGLRKLGMRDEIDRLLGPMADLLLEGKDLSAVNPQALPALLLVAAEWYFLGRDAQAEPVLQAARAVLLKGDLPAKDQNRLACAYARTVGHAPVPAARKWLEEIFTHVKGVRDSYTTRSHYSVSQLELIEAVVLAPACYVPDWLAEAPPGVICDWVQKYGKLDQEAARALLDLLRR
jgi:hypothetical protein